MKWSSSRCFVEAVLSCDKKRSAACRDSRRCRRDPIRGGTPRRERRGLRLVIEYRIAHCVAVDSRQQAQGSARIDREAWFRAADERAPLRSCRSRRRAADAAGWRKDPVLPRTFDSASVRIFAAGPNSSFSPGQSFANSRRQHEFSARFPKDSRSLFLAGASLGPCATRQPCLRHHGNSPQSTECDQAGGLESCGSAPSLRRLKSSPLSDC